jgi:acyl-CoA thioester hydrolase
MQRSDFAHFIKLPVRWGDMDAFGHVNNVQYMRYFESGRVAYVEEVTQTPLEVNENVILADIQVSFLRQLHYPSTVEVATRTSRLGNSSFQIVCAIYRQGEDSPVATCKGVMVWFDYINQRATPIPERVREAIRRFEVTAPEV